MTNQPKQQCSTCRFFMVAEEKPEFGLCRRHPPQWTTKDRGWEFPGMRTIGWCGEYQPPKEVMQ